MTWANRNDYDALITAKLTAEGMSTALLPLIKGFMAEESNFDPRAFRAEPRINDASYGLMQILSKTARAVGWTGSDTSELYDADRNLTFGIRYVKEVLEQFPGDPPAAIAEYNEGPRRATEDVAAGAQPGGTVQFRNEAYVDRVLNFTKQFAAAQGATLDDTLAAAPSGSGLTGDVGLLILAAAGIIGLLVAAVIRAHRG